MAMRHDARRHVRFSENPRRSAVRKTAKDVGLRTGARGRIAGRIRKHLVDAAKARSGINSDTDLLEYASLVSHWMTTSARSSLRVPAACPRISILSFDLKRSLRRLKPQQRSSHLNRRPDADLHFVSERVTGGPELLLDTCVYIDIVQGRASERRKNLLAAWLCNHSGIVLAELTHRLR